MLSTPLRDPFGIPVRLEFYGPDELLDIVTRGAGKLGAPITTEGAMEIAKRARGTPRVAVRLLRRVRDFAGDETIDAKVADAALKRLEATVMVLICSTGAISTLWSKPIQADLSVLRRWLQRSRRRAMRWKT